MKFILRFNTGLCAENPSSLSVFENYPELGWFDRESNETYFQNLTKEIIVDYSIDDWTLSIIIYLGGAMNKKEIAIYKRGITYLNDKEKEVSIRISLPTNDEINWGIAKKYRFNKYANRKTDSGFTILPVDYNQFKNMTDYIESSIKLSLERLFTDGITLKGHKIKI